MTSISIRYVRVKASANLEGVALSTIIRPEAFDPGPTDGIMAEIRRVEKRLRDGEEFLRISRGSDGDAANFVRWESAWIDLLLHYERLCDQVGQYSNTALGPLAQTDNE